MDARIRHALRADLPAIVEIWTDAFSTDPYLRWIVPDDAQWPAFASAWMTFVAQATFERGHTYLEPSGHGAVAWIPPDISLLTPDTLERGAAIITEHTGETLAQAALAVMRESHAHDLDTPHWTLQYLGVRSAAQGTGVGAAIVGPMLDAVDRDGLPSGLVSTNLRNVPFYERLGFAVAAEVSSPDVLVTLRSMHRAGARPDLQARRPK